MRQIKLTRSIIAIQKWQYFLIECQICGETYILEVQKQSIGLEQVTTKVRRASL